MFSFTLKIYFNMIPIDPESEVFDKQKSYRSTLPINKEFNDLKKKEWLNLLTKHSHSVLFYAFYSYGHWRYLSLEVMATVIH